MEPFGRLLVVLFALFLVSAAQFNITAPASSLSASLVTGPYGNLSTLVNGTSTIYGTDITTVTLNRTATMHSTPATLTCTIDHSCAVKVTTQVSFSNVSGTVLRTTKTTFHTTTTTMTVMPTFSTDCANSVMTKTLSEMTMMSQTPTNVFTTQASACTGTNHDGSTVTVQEASAQKTTVVTSISYTTATLYNCNKPTTVQMTGNTISLANTILPSCAGYSTTSAPFKALGSLSAIVKATPSGDADSHTGTLPTDSMSVSSGNSSAETIKPTSKTHSAVSFSQSITEVMSTGTAMANMTSQTNLATNSASSTSITPSNSSSGSFQSGVNTTTLMPFTTMSTETTLSVPVTSTATVLVSIKTASTPTIISVSFLSVTTTEYVTTAATASPTPTIYSAGSNLSHRIPRIFVLLARLIKALDTTTTTRTSHTTTITITITTKVASTTIDVYETIIIHTGNLTQSSSMAQITINSTQTSTFVDSTDNLTQTQTQTQAQAPTSSLAQYSGPVSSNGNALSNVVPIVMITLLVLAILFWCYYTFCYRP